MNRLAEDISRRQLIGGTAALAGWAAASLIAPGANAADAKPAVPGADLFSKPTLLQIQLTLAADAMDALRSKPREAVRASATIADREFPDILVHLKGSTSFLPIDKKASFTLHFGKHEESRPYGLRKFHLNNSVQDSSYMHEDVCGDLFRRAGVPACRVAWAMVRVNDRKPALYVLKEGFTPEFLRLHFSDASGNFYDGGLHHEVDEPLVFESGTGVKDRSDLRALYSASVNGNAASRLPALRKVLDVDRFISMLAMEILTCHIDGYSLMQNNYRIYFDPATKKAVFIAHGMDRMFEKPEMPLDPIFRACVSKAVVGGEEGRRLYAARLNELVPAVFNLNRMVARTEATGRMLTAAMPLVASRATSMCKRLTKRAEFVSNNLPDLLKN